MAVMSRFDDEIVVSLLDNTNQMY